MKAVWNDKIVADSEETVYIEGNHYFPPDSIKHEFFEKSDLTTICYWKGTANYYSLIDGEIKTENAAWYYAEPKDGSEDKVKHIFKNYVAFYPHQVQIIPS
jgi:uncharacterized protein (DUF427 family)